MKCTHGIRFDKECWYCANGVDKPKSVEYVDLKEKPNENEFTSVLKESFDLGDGSNAKVVYADDYKTLLEAYEELKWRMEGLEK